MACLMRLLLLLSTTMFGCGVSLATDQAEVDLRLAQRVSVDCVNTRLYKALDKISTKTGVIIHAGKNNSDWKVRDMPTLVCSRNLPLGTLLRGITDASHLLWSSNKIDDTTTYRIWRDLKREKELNAFEQSRKEAALAATSYDWDVISRVKDMPESDFDDDPQVKDDRAMTTAVSKILSELGPNVKSRVLAGETIVLTLLNAPESIKPYMMEAFEAFYKIDLHLASRDGKPAPKPLEEQLKRSYIDISFGRPGDYPDKLCVGIWLQGMTEIDHYIMMLIMQDKKAFLSSRPKVPKPILENDKLNPRYTRLSLTEKGGPEFLDKKIKVPVPKDKKNPTYSDLLLGMSRAIGYSLIAEGPAARYNTHIWTKQQELPDLFGREITIREILGFSAEIDNMDWYLDEKNRLILGRDREWTERVKSLVSEKLLLDLREKLNGSGVELDDLQPLAGLTQNQCYEWIHHCPEYPEIELLSHCAFSLKEDSESLWVL